MQVRDRIEKENVCGQPKRALPPLPPPGHKIDIKVILCIKCCSCHMFDTPGCQDCLASCLAGMLRNELQIVCVSCKVLLTGDVNWVPLLLELLKTVLHVISVLWVLPIRAHHQRLFLRGSTAAPAFPPPPCPSAV